MQADLPAATRGFKIEDRASSERMIHPRRTRTCGEMRGEIRLGRSGRPMGKGLFRPMQGEWTTGQGVRFWVEAAGGVVIQGVNCQLPIRNSGFHAEG